MSRLSDEGRTFRSRGIDNMPAELVSGLKVSRMIESVRAIFWPGRASTPSTRMVVRLTAGVVSSCCAARPTCRKNGSWADAG